MATCNNILLIKEAEFLGNSLFKINTNFFNLSSGICDLEKELKNFYKLVDSLSAKDSQTIDMSFSSNGYFLSADVVDNSIGTKKLGIDIPDTTKAFLTAVNVSSLIDTNVTQIFPEEVLKWDGSKWVNTSLTNEIGATRFSGLLDVKLNNIKEGQIIKYNAASSKWTNADDLSLSGLPDKDYGDITVSQTSQNWQINPKSVSTGELANRSVTDAKITNKSVSNRHFVNRGIFLDDITDDFRSKLGETNLGQNLFNISQVGYQSIYVDRRSTYGASLPFKTLKGAGGVRITQDNSTINIFADPVPPPPSPTASTANQAGPCYKKTTKSSVNRYIFTADGTKLIKITCPISFTANDGGINSIGYAQVMDSSAFVEVGSLDANVVVAGNVSKIGAISTSAPKTIDIYGNVNYPPSTADFPLDVNSVAVGNQSSIIRIKGSVNNGNIADNSTAFYSGQIYIQNNLIGNVQSINDLNTKLYIGANVTGNIGYCNGQIYIGGNVFGNVDPSNGKVYVNGNVNGKVNPGSSRTTNIYINGDVNGDVYLGGNVALQAVPIYVAGSIKGNVISDPNATGIALYCNTITGTYSQSRVAPFTGFPSGVPNIQMPSMPALAWPGFPAQPATVTQVIECCENIGVGPNTDSTPIYKDTTTVGGEATFNFRTILGAGDVQVQQTGDEIIISRSLQLGISLIGIDASGNIQTTQQIKSRIAEIFPPANFAPQTKCRVEIVYPGILNNTISTTVSVPFSMKYQYQNTTTSSTRNICGWPPDPNCPVTTTNYDMVLTWLDPVSTSVLPAGNWYMIKNLPVGLPATSKLTVTKETSILELTNSGTAWI